MFNASQRFRGIYTLPGYIPYTHFVLLVVMASALVAAVYLILCSVLILSGRLIEGAETCTPDSGNPCRCNVAGGDSVDLTKLFQSGPLSAQYVR